MHASVSVSGARQRLLALPRAMRRPPRPGKPLLVAAACLSALTLLLGVILVYTPIAHPKTLVVEGVTGSSQARIVRLLEEEGARQSTFAVDRDALMRAVAAYPEVADIEVDSHPPFRLDLRAVMRPPVGRLTLAGQTFVVAADGTMLKRATNADVPRLDASVGDLSVKGGRIAGAGGVLGVLAAAPDTMLAFARSVSIGHAGIEIEFTRGPRLIFGAASEAAEKWAAAAAVIADGSANGATYIDLRVPSRPAVGGIGGSKTAPSADPPMLTAAQPGGQTQSTTSTASTQQSTTAQSTAATSTTTTDQRALQQNQATTESSAQPAAGSSGDVSSQAAAAAGTSSAASPNSGTGAQQGGGAAIAP